MPTLVQNATTTHSFGAGNGNTVVTLSATTPGNLIAVAFQSAAYSGSFTISDSSGSNTWIIASPTNANSQNPPCAYDSANGFSTFVAWTFSTASLTTVTVATGSKHYAGTATASEWSGLGAYDTSSSAFNDTGTDPATAPALTLAAASDVVIAAAFPQFGTMTPDSPLTSFSTDASGITVYAQPGSSGSFTPTWANAGGRNWAAAAAAFKPSSGTSHTATASLTVTPSFSAARVRGKYRAGLLQVVPAFASARQVAHVRAAALAVLPRFTETHTGGAARGGGNGYHHYRRPG